MGEHSLTAEKMYSISFTDHRKKYCLSLHYNEANSYLFLNGTEIIKSKAKNSEIVAKPLRLGNISKDWSVDSMKDAGLNGYVYDFSVDYHAIAVDDILDIRKYLMKKNNMILKCLGLLKKSVFCRIFIKCKSVERNSIECNSFERSSAEMCFNG